MIINGRSGDDPRFKEPVIAELYGKFIGYIEEKGLTSGKEFKGTTQDCFSCSKRYIHIWDNDDSKDCQIVVFLCSTQFRIEFGVYNKKTKEVTYRNKLDNLRYKISDGEQVELIDSHQEKFNEYFKDFKNKFNEQFALHESKDDNNVKGDVADE